MFSIEINLMFLTKEEVSLPKSEVSNKYTCFDSYTFMIL